MKLHNHHDIQLWVPSASQASLKGHFYILFHIMSSSHIPPLGVSHIFLSFHGHWVPHFFTDRCQTQFFIQLVYKPHFGTLILLFGSFWQLWVEKKFSISEQLLRVFFSTFCGQKHCKGPLISKGPFAIFEFFQKTNETIRS